MSWRAGQGNRADLRFGTKGHGWDGFEVVRFHGVEEISRLFQFEIILRRAAPAGFEMFDAERAAALAAPVDLDDLVDAPSTLAIHTGNAAEAPGARAWRLVHGILAEAEEIDRGPQYHLYRVLLVPHVYRARHRRRCRNFVDRRLKKMPDKDPKGIVELVLENAATGHESPGLEGLTLLSQRPSAPSGEPSFESFVEPVGYYRWELGEPERMESDQVHGYVVQYNESDFDFVSRLLEEEGISYYFEHFDGGLCLTLTDRPGHEPFFPVDARLEYKNDQGGMTAAAATVSTFRRGRRMRPASVTMRDYYWPQPDPPFREGMSMTDGDDPAGLEYFEFPARDEGTQERAAIFPATVRMQRFQVERNLAAGSGRARTMEPGFAVQITNIAADGAGSDDLLIVRVETFAKELDIPVPVLQSLPFGFHGRSAEGRTYETEFLVLPRDVAFRPAIVTRRPRIHGVQTATVTAEELSRSEHGPRDHTEINCDEHGRVRVRFPWDQKPVDGSKTSMWMRVSNQWAGPGFGGLYTPRVGHEVLVAYLQGDPERPVIVGRVYNGRNLPPTYPVDQHRTRSTLRSDSTDNDSRHRSAGFNEMRFEDRLHREQIYVHAQRNLDEEVLCDHSTHVGNDQSNTVDRDQFNHIKRNRKHTIDGEEVVTVNLDRMTQLLSSEKHFVNMTRETDVGTGEILHVHATRSSEIDEDDSRTVHRDDVVQVDRNRGVTVNGNHQVTTQGYFTQETTYNHVENTHQDFWHTTTGDDHYNAGNAYHGARHFQINANTVKLWVRDSFELHVGSSEIHVTPGTIDLSTGHAHVTLSGNRITVNAEGPVEVHGSQVTVQASSGDVTVNGTNVKLNP